MFNGSVGLRITTVIIGDLSHNTWANTLWYPKAKWWSYQLAFWTQLVWWCLWCNYLVPTYTVYTVASNRLAMTWYHGFCQLCTFFAEWHPCLAWWYLHFSWSIVCSSKSHCQSLPSLQAGILTEIQYRYSPVSHFWWFWWVLPCPQKKSPNMWWC